MAWAYDKRTDRHEHIHGEQQKELFFVGTIINCIMWLLGCGWWSLLTLPIFFYWCGIEYLIRWIHYKNQNDVYRNIVFEREAYLNDNNILYLKTRKYFSWIKYLK